MAQSGQFAHGYNRGFEDGVKAQRGAWRRWYDSLPESLRSQIDAHEVARREEMAA